MVKKWLVTKLLRGIIFHLQRSSYHVCSDLCSKILTVFGRLLRTSGRGHRLLDKRNNLYPNYTESCPVKKILLVVLS